MGKYYSKSGTIYNYSKIKIPQEYHMLKMVSFKTNLRHTINMEVKIHQLVNILTDNYRQKSIDILCIQGIGDYIAAVKLITEITKHSEKSGDVFYFAPEFAVLDNINSVTSININSEINSKNRRSRSSRFSTDIKGIIGSNREIHNIIISRYPIVSTIFGDLDLNKNILEKKTIIGANISIFGNLISVYTTSLIKNMKNMGITNDNKRAKQIKNMNIVINHNIQQLRKRKYMTYNKTDIHLITGNLNISEINNGIITKEYSDFISKTKFVDIFRYLNSGEDIQNRKNYILLKMTDDIYRKRGDYYKLLDECRNPSDILKLIMKRYRIHFFDMYVRKDILHFNDTWEPIETVFMIHKNKH